MRRYQTSIVCNTDRPKHEFLTVLLYSFIVFYTVTAASDGFWFGLENGVQSIAEKILFFQTFIVYQDLEKFVL